MSRNELVTLIKKAKSNKKLYNIINNLINILHNKKCLNKLKSKKIQLEHIIANQNDRISEGLMENCNHFFVNIKSNEEHKIICPKCGLTNMYEDVGIYGNSKECMMNRIFLRKIKNIDEINIHIELGIFMNPLYALGLYSRIIQENNCKDDTEVIKKMMELKKKDLEETSIRKVLK